MKRNILIIMLLLLFSGCAKLQESTPLKKELLNDEDKVIITTEKLNDSTSSDSPKVNKIIINEKSIDEKGTFYIGMIFDEIKSLDLYNTDYEITQIILIEDDENDWDYGHKVVWTPNTCFIFDETDTLYSITVNGELPTTLGLKNGDPISAVEKLYGKSKHRYDFSWGYVVEYSVGDNYFNVSIIDGVVNLWGISKYRYDYKGK